MNEKSAAGYLRCIYEDVDRDRPLLALPGHYGPAFGRGIPPKQWCWTHGSWEAVTPEATDGAP